MFWHFHYTTHGIEVSFFYAKSRTCSFIVFKLTYDLIVGVVEEKSKGLNITEEDKKFIADFYKYGFVGIMLEWIREGMKENIEDLVRMMDLTLHDTVTTSIHNFQKNNMEK